MKIILKRTLWNNRSTVTFSPSVCIRSRYFLPRDYKSSPLFSITMEHSVALLGPIVPGATNLFPVAAAHPLFLFDTARITSRIYPARVRAPRSVLILTCRLYSDDPCIPNLRAPSQYRSIILHPRLPDRNCRNEPLAVSVTGEEYR